MFKLRQRDDLETAVYCPRLTHVSYCPHSAKKINEFTNPRTVYPAMQRRHRQQGTRRNSAAHTLTSKEQRHDQCRISTFKSSVETDDLHDGSDDDHEERYQR